MYSSGRKTDRRNFEYSYIEDFLDIDKVSMYRISALIPNR